MQHLININVHKKRVFVTVQAQSAFKQI